LAGAGRSGPAWTPAPEGLIAAELDRLTGQLATAETPEEQRYTEYFLDGTEPIELRMNAWRILKGGTVIF
jgi:hypothetical protein